MSINSQPISLNQVYSRQGARLLGEYKVQHQHNVAKTLYSSEVILYAWWYESQLNRLYLYLYLATDKRLIWYMPRQFDIKATILDTFSFEYEHCERAYLKKQKDNLFSKSRYIIHVDHNLHYAMSGLDLDDKFYGQIETEKITETLTTLIDTAKDKS